jgi:hypothetical protein
MVQLIGLGTKGNAPTGRVISIHFFENAYNNNESYMVNSRKEMVKSYR